MLPISSKKGEIVFYFVFCVPYLTRFLYSAFITEYGGVLISASTARAMPAALQAWLRTLSSMHSEIDGNPSRFAEGHITMADRHVLGSLLNHSIRRQNTEFFPVDETSPELVDEVGRQQQGALLIRATRNIHANEQLLISYGSSAKSFRHIPF